MLAMLERCGTRLKPLMWMASDVSAGASAATSKLNTSAKPVTTSSLARKVLVRLLELVMVYMMVL